ncbi:MAG: ubiquinone/menaquinone biosynthesis methyltransferase [Anaerohalosphaeraceae bacterium]
MTQSNTPTTEPMFSAIARRYDLCNHLFSFGLDFYWRHKAAAIACDGPIISALDLCCGTGDMTFALAKTGQLHSIIGCDIARPMLDIAAQKAKKYAATNTTIQWHCASAENTGLPEAAFDRITCAFGFRNVDDLPAALKESHRLLKPGGKLCILEFFLPQQGLSRRIYLFYLCRIMPLVAGWIVGTSAPWHYLAQSIHRWETVDLTAQLRHTGFRDIIVRSLTFGTVRIHTAQKGTP